MKAKHLLILFFLIVGLGQSNAQIVDDSTRNVYGTETTKFVLEKDIYENDTTLRSIDTSLVNYRYFHPARRSGYIYQDLGHNLGTAIKPLFYQAPSRIGVQWGFEAYQPYILKSSDIHYYDTKSPFTSFSFVQGGSGQQNIKVEFSRNITPLWNFGFSYQRVNTFRQYASTGNRLEDAILELYNGSFFMRKQSKNKKYQFLASYTHFTNQVQELGGIADVQDSLYEYDEELAQLSNEVSSWQTQNNIRLYQEYQMNDLLRLFMVNEYFWQRDNYRDEDLATNADFYQLAPSDSFRISQNRIGDDYKFHLLTNQIGIKGRKGAVNYWTYFKRRDFNVKNGAYDSLYTVKGQSENFVGGRLNLYLADSILFDFEGEYLIGRDYLAKAQFRSKWFSAGVQSTFYSPSILQNRFFSNVNQWDNNFDNTFSNEVFGEVNISFKNLTIKPFARYSIVTNYIYFAQNSDSVIVPTQQSDAIQITQIGLRLAYQWRKFHLDADVRYTENVSEFDVIRFPTILANAHLYYQGKIYKDVVFGQIGFDVNFRSEYFADAYMPVYKQFYVQDDFLVRAYPLVDVYGSFRIKRFRAFLKMNHLNQGWLPPPNNGYTVTPFYAGMRRTFVFGFNWLFFD